MSTFKNLANKQRAEWLSHVRPEILALAKRRERVTLAEWRDLRMNSYEREEVIPNLSDEALIEATQETLKWCSPDKRRPCSVYDDALALVFVPLLLERLKLHLKEIEPW